MIKYVRLQFAAKFPFAIKINKFTRFYNQLYRILFMPVSEDPKKINKYSRGPPLKEFQWFEVETKLRKIIQEIIQPIQYEIVKNSSQIEKLQKNDDSFHDKIQYIMRMTTNDPEVFQNGVFKKIQEKFQQQQKTLSFLQEQVKNNTIFIDNKINLIDQRMKQSNDMIQQIQALKASNRDNLKYQTQKFQTVRTNIEKNVQTMSIAIEQNHKNSGEKIEKLEKDIRVIVMKMENVEKQFTVVKNYFGAQKSLNDDLIAQGIKLKEEGRQFDTKIFNLDKKLKQLSKIKPFLQDIQTDYRKFMFKVDNIVPLINEAQINESLYKILPSKFHPRIAVYEFEKYLELNEKVLARNFDLDALGIEFNGQQLIRQSQERNTKLLTKMKLQYYKSSGVDLDFISFQERERLLNDFDYPKLCEIVDQLQELQNQKNDRKKNHKLTQQDIIKLVNKQVQHDKLILIEKIHTEIQDSKTYLQNSSEQLQRVIDTIEQRVFRLSQNLETQKNMNDLIDKRFDRYEGEAHAKMGVLTESIKDLQDFGKEIIIYLDSNSKRMKETKELLKDFEKYQKANLGNRLHSKNRQKQSLYKEENLKTKLDVMMNEEGQSNELNQKISNQQKINPQSMQDIKIEQEDEKLLQTLKKIALKFTPIKEQRANQTRLKSSFSKLTRPSETDFKYRSQSTFNQSKRELNLNELNKSTQIHKSPQKSSIKGLLDIPEFKGGSSTRYCRQSHTSRLSIRKKPLMNPPRTQFMHTDDGNQSISFKSNEVRNSLGYFTQLKRQNSRFLS